MNQDLHCQPKQAVVGIDVGGEEKGFHAVALVDGKFVDRKTDSDPSVIVDWCLDHKAVQKTGTGYFVWGINNKIGFELTRL